MQDLVNNKLPGSFDEFIPMTNTSNYDITTRQSNILYITRPRTTFSSNLPNHNFAKMWNEFDITYQQYKPKDNLLINLRSPRDCPSSGWVARSSFAPVPVR